jgi:hypothetical protein
VFAIKNIEITERDMMLFELLAKTGVCTIGQTKEVYGGEWYHYKRIEKLVANKYLKKYGRQLKLSKKASALLQQI